MATRTTTTRTTRRGCEPSADGNAGHHADFSFTELVQAYFDCRKTKRNTASALVFEADLEANLSQLDQDLRDGTYKPGPTICFVITRPKPREVLAAAFRDRIVHHLLYNRVSPRFYAAFIADSCACIPGRGTLYAANRLEAKIRSATQNWSRPAHYLKCDLQSFFVSIDKNRLFDQLAAKIPETWWLALTDTILFHDPRPTVELRGGPGLFARIPAHKSLFSQPKHLGLPIGNLSSQFFANVYLDALDQFVKHQLRAKHYIRYVDDFIILHESPAWLNEAHRRIREFLPMVLGAKLNDSKTILQPVDRGVDFVGQVIKPWRRTTRLRTVRDGLHRIATMSQSDVFESGNSYFGQFRQATHGRQHRADLANVLRARGFSVNRDLTKTYRRPA